MSHLSRLNRICQTSCQMLSTHRQGASSLKVCIAGSGPAGFYAAQQLVKGNPNLQVDIYEKLPVPFGLVRYGVAPDHPEVKNVINTFTKTANNHNVTFMGNVNIGRDVKVAELRKAYHAVILAYGAAQDHLLNISGEALPNVLSARSFVGWYNGVPEDKDLQVNLDCEDAVIIGQGNVAVDVARMLLTPVDMLKNTDITQHALEVLSESRLKRVHIVGRRGPLNVAFTIKELRELVNLPGCRPEFLSADFEGLQDLLKDMARPRKRLTELLLKTALEVPSEKLAKQWSQAEKTWHLKFFRSPLEILPNDDFSSVRGVKFGINKLEVASQKVSLTGETETLACGILMRSIGYKSFPVEDGIPFDANRGVIRNESGRVINSPGLYCCGWLATGPVGVILSTMMAAFEVGKLILQDLEEGVISTAEEKQGKQAVKEILHSRGVHPVTFTDWEKIDHWEQQRGEMVGKPREKVTDVCEMLEIVKK